MTTSARRVQRSFLIAFVTGGLVCLSLALSASTTVRNTVGDIPQFNKSVAGIPFLAISRSGRSVSIAPRYGVALALIVLPALAAAAHYSILKRRGTR